MQSEAYRALLSARTAMLSEDPFFGVLSLRLPLVEDPTAETAWTDGARIGYNPGFVLSLTESQLKTLVAHEVAHVANGHPWRRNGREPERWNKACDYAINSDLVRAGYAPLADWYLSDEFAGKSAEWIFDRLPPEADDGNGNGNGSGSGGAGDDVRDAPSPADDPDAPTEAEWHQAAAQAAAVAKGRGELGPGAERIAKRIASPRVDWRSVLHRFAMEAAKNDYSWKKPNRRYAPRGLYLPSLHSTELGTVAVAVDVSGSVDDVLLSQMAAEINAIADHLQPAAIDVIYCDWTVRKREIFRRGEDVQLSACGGAGTDFRPVFAELEEDPPVCLVYLTDLAGRFPDSAPDYPVLWATTEKESAPFGETVYCGG